QSEVNAETLNAQDNEGLTALMWAVNKGNIGVVKALLAHRDSNDKPLINVNVKDNKGHTAQMIASAFGKEEINKIISAHRLSISPWNALQRSSLFSNVSENRVGITLGFMGVLAAVAVGRCYSP
ncbi:MAG: ankyrin repeat domain-containing protein, partial [Pseudomonadota bacterium]|nr:ankyrin repeat domain-containing protein [Pseudomonadota bacterium]